MRTEMEGDELWVLDGKTLEGIGCGDPADLRRFTHAKTANDLSLSKKLEPSWHIHPI